MCWQWIPAVQVFISHGCAQSCAVSNSIDGREVAAATVGCSGGGNCNKSENSRYYGEDNSDSIGDPELGFGISIHVVVGFMGYVYWWRGEGGGSVWSDQLSTLGLTTEKHGLMDWRPTEAASDSSC
jgi:hypothetical protein